MVLTPRLELRQSQALVMTPQLQQAIKLLQLSNMELNAYVEDELARNPLLEREDGDGDGDGFEGETGSSDGAEVADSAESASGDGSEDVDGLDAIDFAESPGGAVTENLDVDYDNLWNNDSAAESLSDPAFANWGAGGGNGFDGADRDLEQTVSGSASLRDHLSGQLNVELSAPADRVIGQQLLDRLDEAGYVDAADLAAVAEVLDCPVERVERVLGRLQQLDPPGIFARNLSECLALQLKERDRLDPAMQALLENLDLLAKRDIAALSRVCGVDREDLVEMVAEIRALDPKPATSFDTEVAQSITPDVIMRPGPGGGWVVELNSETLPRLLVNNRYHAVVSKAVRTKEERHYVDECFHSASWLVKALHQRATTILKVATEIVRQQEGFFLHGVQALRPLVLRDIAEAIEMHESTVSRVTSNKFMASPRGIFELKYFFTQAIANSAGGAAHSAESVRSRIRQLIDAEPPDGILSDDKIVDILTAAGMDIARRTVAKYRESMGIRSSVQRRRQKASGL